jgi:thioredoxin reductase
MSLALWDGAGKLGVVDIEWDCIVVGGGAAGLGAALVLGRARRRTLVVDEGKQSNLVAHGIGGLLGHDGRPPRIPGLDALWGRSAFHCPFCHGWEVRDQPLAVLAQGERAMHMALMLRGWTDDVVALTNGPAGLDATQCGQLAAAGVAVEERPVAEFISHAGELDAVSFADGAQLARRGVLVATTMHQRSDLAAQLGVTAAPPGPLAAEAFAIAAGSLAAAAVVQGLLADDVGLPVPPWPTQKEDTYAHA